MKGKIDKDGNLHIERAGKMKGQMCPNQHPYAGSSCCCGDWCPLFGSIVEGKQHEMVDTHLELKHDGTYHIEICDRKLLNFTEFTDEREQEENE